MKATKQAGQWLRRIAKKAKRNKTARLLLEEAIKVGIKKAVDTAPDWLPVVLELVERNN